MKKDNILKDKDREYKEALKRKPERDFVLAKIEKAYCGSNSIEMHHRARSLD